MIKSGQSGTWAAVVVGILLQGKTGKNFRVAKVKLSHDVSVVNNYKKLVILSV